MTIRIPLSRTIHTNTFQPMPTKRPAPSTPRSKGADAAGGPSPLTAAATLFGTRSRSSPEKTSTPPRASAVASAASTSTPTSDALDTDPITRARSVDRAKIIIDNKTNAMMVELLSEDKHNSNNDSSDNDDDDDDDASDNGFSDTDGASSDDDDSTDNANNDGDDVSAVSSDNGCVQLNLSGGSMHILDRTIASSRSKAISITPSPRASKAGAKSSARVLTPASHKPSSLSSSPPPPPPPPRPQSRASPPPPHHKTATSSSESRSPAPGPLQYPPGIPRHKRDRVLLPSPLPSPAKSRNRWRRKSSSSSSSASTDRVESPGRSAANRGTSGSNKTSTAAASVLAANLTPGTPRSRKSRSRYSNNNTPRRSDSSGDADSSLLMGRRKREEESLSRLVDLAKRQQRFAAAWFAASQGATTTDVPPPPPPSTKHGLGPQVLPLPSGVAVRDVSTTGPIDADSGEAWQDEPGRASSSNGSTCLGPSTGIPSPARGTGNRGVLVTHFISNRGSSAQQGRDDDISFVSSSSSNKTPKMANTSPDRHSSDVERGLPSSPLDGAVAELFIDVSNDEAEASKRNGDSFWTREIRIGSCRIGTANCLVIVLLLTIVAGAAIIVVVGSSGGQGPRVDDGSNAAVQEGGNIFSDDINIPEDESNSLDGAWTELDVVAVKPPTGRPPTTTPATNVPSDNPTQFPSLAPSGSQQPSPYPTFSPSSFYQTTGYNQIGMPMVGKDLDVQFGYSIALSADGTVMAVGSRYVDDNGARSGEVRVFILVPSQKDKRDKDQSGIGTEGTWEQLGKPLKGRNEADQFGFSVALSNDGLTLAASEPGYDGSAGDRSGNVRVFRYDSGKPKLYETDGSWTKIGDISGEDSTALFGVSISLDGDGKRLAVGAPYHDSDALDALGEPLRKAGRVRVFEYEGTEWKRLGQPLDGTSPSDWFGWSVSISSAGTTLAVGAIRNISGGYVRVFELEEHDDASSVKWNQLGEDLHSISPEKETRMDIRYGHAVALSDNGGRIVVGSPNSDNEGALNAGMAVIYERSSDNTQTNVWSILGDAIFGRKDGSELGWDVAISGDATLVVLGSPGDSLFEKNAGSASVYRWSDAGLAWEPSKPLYSDEEEGNFGFSVDMSADGSVIGVGSPAQNGDATGSTEVFLYEN